MGENAKTNGLRLVVNMPNSHEGIEEGAVIPRKHKVAYVSTTFAASQRSQKDDPEILDNLQSLECWMDAHNLPDGVIVNLPTQLFRMKGARENVVPDATAITTIGGKELPMPSADDIRKFQAANAPKAPAKPAAPAGSNDQTEIPF